MNWSSNNFFFKIPTWLPYYESIKQNLQQASTEVWGSWPSDIRTLSMNIQRTDIGIQIEMQKNMAE